MAITRRTKRRGKQSILVRFQPWLIAGGVILNVVASGSAAVSAWFSWQQVHASIDAVNVASKNQAFSEYLAAFINVCRVSLVPEDQDDFETHFAGPDAYANLSDRNFEILAINQDHLEKRRPPDVVAFLAEANKRRAVMWEKWLQLVVWLDDEERANLSGTYPDYIQSFIDDDKRPAAYFAVEQQRRCRLISSSLIRLYKNPSDEQAKADALKEIWIIPTSATRSTEDILKAWGREDILESLKAKGLWPVPQ